MSAANTLCSKSKLRVMLAEGKRIGSNQTVRAVFSDAISSFGLEDSVLQKYDEYLFKSFLGAEARFNYGSYTLSAVDYGKACQILFDRATKNGLELRKGNATHWIPEKPGPGIELTVHFKKGDPVQTKILIDASGPVQWAARQLQIRRSVHMSVCFGEFLQGCLIPEIKTCCLLAPNRRFGNGGGWFYPISKNAVSYGYSAMVMDLQSRPHVAQEGYLSAKRLFQPYADWVKHSQVKSLEIGTIPVGRIGRFCDHRILIVGDAGGQANPWTVEGCRPALVNGDLCAQVAMDAFRIKRFDKTSLDRFEKRWKGNNRERFWRSSSYADVMWAQPDEAWERFIGYYKKIPPERQLLQLRENYASVFGKIYAVGGYARRKVVNWAKILLSRLTTAN